MFVHLREEKYPNSAARSALTNATQTGSRRLLTYRRLPDTEISVDALAAYHVQRLELQEANPTGVGGTANDLNDFRKKVRQHHKHRTVQVRSGKVLTSIVSNCSISKDFGRLSDYLEKGGAAIVGESDKNEGHERADQDEHFPECGKSIMPDCPRHKTAFVVQGSGKVIRSRYG
jgi:hypothetical protein